MVRGAPQLQSKRVGQRFEHTNSVLKAASESKRCRRPPTQAAKEFLTLSRRFAQNIQEFGARLGVEVLSVNLHGSVKRGLAVTGSDVDMALFVRFKKGIRGEDTKRELLDKLFSDIREISDKAYGPLVSNFVFVNTTVYPEDELHGELYSKPSHIYVFLTSKPLLGRKYYMKLRKQLIEIINKNPKLAKDIMESHKKVMRSRIAARMAKLGAHER